MNQFVWGALTMASCVAALFFLKYFRTSRDRLFLFFFFAFLAYALNYLGLAFISPNLETRHHIYLVRLLAFSLILAGIYDKNRRARR